MTSADDLSALTASLSRWELAGYVAVAAVAIGVAGEVIHDFLDWFKSYEWWARKGNKASALLLVAALVAELVIQVKTNSISGRIIAFVEKEAADAIERAAHIEQAAAWRILDPEKFLNLHAALATNNDERSVVVGFPVGDPESIAFASQIINAFNGTKWTVTPVGHWYESQWVSGVRVLGSDTVGAGLLKQALSSAGISFTTDPVPTPGMYNGGVPDETKLFLYLGTKPPPKF